MATTARYLAPKTVAEVTRMLAEGEATVLAGGTDLWPSWAKQGVDRPDVVIDLKKIEELHGITLSSGEVSIGACTRMSDIAADPRMRSAAPILAEAVGRVACPQIRNRATLGGNLCNASPAADAAVPLLVLDASVEIASFREGEVKFAEVPIDGFFRGPGTTALARDEILTRVRFRLPSERTITAWNKFGTRPAMEIAVASVGMALRMTGDKVEVARIAYGSVAPVPMRGRKAEAELLNQPLSAEAIERCAAAAREEIAPISDVRAGEAYRREVVGVMLRRMLEDAGNA